MPESPDEIRIGAPISRQKHKALVLACALKGTTIRAMIVAAIDDIIVQAQILDIDALWASLAEEVAEMESPDAQ